MLRVPKVVPTVKHSDGPVDDRADGQLGECDVEHLVDGLVVLARALLNTWRSGRGGVGGVPR